MTDPVTEASPTGSPAPATPVPDNPAALSPDQAASWLEQLGQQVEWRDRLLKNDFQARKLFDQLVAKRSEADTAEAVVVAATDPTALLPPSGAAANDHGVSPADRKVGVQGLLANGLSPGSAVELLKNEPVCTPEEYEFHRREFAVRCLGDATWRQRLLSGDLEARRQLLAMGVIKITSQPSPWGPTPGAR